MECSAVSKVHDEFWNVLTQNIVPWFIDYFKLQKCEKQPVQEGLSNLLQKQVIKPLCGRCLPHHHKERIIPVSEDRGTQRNLSEPLLLSCHPFPH